LPSTFIDVAWRMMPVIIAATSEAEQFSSVRAMRATCRVLLVSGSLRAMSTNTALLRTARTVAPGAVEAVLYDGLGTLPHFNPDDDPDGGPVHAAVADLRAQIAAADALLFCTPEYAGALPGSFKNLLDWTVGGGETYGMPVGWVNASGVAAPTGAAGAYGSLRSVLTYTGADIVEAACVRIPVARGSVGPDGLIADASVRDGVAAVLATLAEHVAAGPEPG
jgi:chromate reductase